MKRRQKGVDQKRREQGNNKRNKGQSHDSHCCHDNERLRKKCIPCHGTMQCYNSAWMKEVKKGFMTVLIIMTLAHSFEGRVIIKAVMTLHTDMTVPTALTVYSTIIVYRAKTVPSLSHNSSTTKP